MGWILIVSVLHLGIVLVYSIGVPHKYFTIMFWIVVPLLFILVTWLAYLREKRYGLKTLIYFWIAGIWGMFGAFLSTYVNRQFI
jgi:TctA family transporter